MASIIKLSSDSDPNAKAASIKGPILVNQSIKSPKRNHFWRWMGMIALILMLAFGITLKVMIDHAEPILRARVIETLSVRFQSKVELAALHVSVADGLQVYGEGLKIYGKTDPNIQQPGVQALIAIDEFRFRTGVMSLLRTPMHVQTVYLKGLVLNIPPAGDRKEMGNMQSKSGKIKIVVDQFTSDGARLVINTSRPDKLPLEFEIGSLKMKDIGPGQPLHFDATLINPKPIGEIVSSGSFGPLEMDRPRDTPVKGKYSFSDADLSTIKGIGGILSSTGEYSGNLGEIAVDGATDTPDFRLDVSGHPVPLHTDFHAIVDGTTGDTYLQPVKAKVLNSSFTAKGSVVRIKDPKGHSVSLDVSIDKARIQDLLELGVRTDPPFMTGAIKSKVKLDILPGEVDVAQRMKLAGNFQITGAHFTNDKVQTKVDDLSLRSQGKPKLAQQNVHEEVASDLTGVFKLASGVLSFSEIHFQMPGTKVNLTGEYSLDGNKFDFYGKVGIEATLSHTVTGWKSIVLKPVDPFFKKNGNGAEIPVKISGTKSEPHFGLDFGHHDKPKPAQTEAKH
jgi:hypothetical protein